MYQEYSWYVPYITERKVPLHTTTMIPVILWCDGRTDKCAETKNKNPKTPNASRIDPFYPLRTLAKFLGCELPSQSDMHSQFLDAVPQT